MATPHVAGVAGLLILKDSTLTANQIQAIIQFSSDDKGGTGRDEYYGYGRLNAYSALLLATGQRTLFNGSSNLHKGSVYTEGGHLVVEDKVIGSATSGQLTPSTSDVWVLRDNTTPTPLVIARLTSAGTLYLKGTWAEKQSSLSPPSGSPLVFRNNSSVVTAYIDLNGNLKVKGRIFMGDDPDRSSSQGK